MLFADEATGWEKWAQLWGPAVPMFLVLMFYIHRLVFRTIPNCFRAQRKLLQQEFHVQTRVLRQHSEMLALICQRIGVNDKTKIRTRRKKKPRSP